MMLLVRGILDGVEVVYGRFYEWLIKLGGAWLIRRRVLIYEKDRIEAVSPGESIQLVTDELGKYPEGYRYMTHLQACSRSKK